MTVDEFTDAYPEFAFDFSKLIRDQTRILEPSVLEQLPMELMPTHPYQPGGRGRANPNQTLTHYQCATCLRVLRNDQFYTPPSKLRKNVLHTECRSCAQQANAHHYDASAKLIQSRRLTIWQFLAPSCTLCGFDKHTSALDMHHLGGKETTMAALITAVTFTPSSRNIEKLLREASRCIPLCSNCHRMLHAGVLSLPEQLPRPAYRLAELLKALRSPES
ncbi:MAG: hypothetical protein IT329_16060 [Caldilineaceae bacterium]|nr:hypothetical protein [Caldilineaceae bacterium]